MTIVCFFALRGCYGRRERQERHGDPVGRLCERGVCTVCKEQTAWECARSAAPIRHLESQVSRQLVYISLLFLLLPHDGMSVCPAFPPRSYDGAFRASGDVLPVPAPVPCTCMRATTRLLLYFLTFFFCVLRVSALACVSFLLVLFSGRAVVCFGFCVCKQATLRRSRG